MTLSRVATQRQWDSHMTHTRTNNRCSSLNSIPRKGAAAQYGVMRSGLAGPHTEHAQHITHGPAVEQSKWQKCSFLNLGFCSTMYSVWHFTSLIFVSCVSSLPFLEGVKVWLGLSPRDDLALRVGLVCGHPLRSKVTGHGVGPAHLRPSQCTNTRLAHW